MTLDDDEDVTVANMMKREGLLPPLLLMKVEAVKLMTGHEDDERDRSHLTSAY